MIQRRHVRLAVVVPMALIAVCLWLLVGCLYIPTRDMVYRTGSKQDFRPLVGDPGSSRPIVVGRISRANIEAILGPAPFVSADHHRAMYVVHVKKDIWLAPLCFTAANGYDEAIGLVLTFDDAGVLSNWQQLYSAESHSDLMDGPFGPRAAFTLQDRGDDDLLNQANPQSTPASSKVADRK